MIASGWNGYLKASRFQDVAPTVTAYRWAYATRTGSVSRSRVKSLLPTIARIPTKPFIVSCSGAWCPQSSGHLRVELHRTRTPVAPGCGYESSSRKRANRQMARRTEHCAGYGHRPSKIGFLLFPDTCWWADAGRGGLNKLAFARLPRRDGQGSGTRPQKWHRR
jgi:hypothetical protein